jgi:hypothetical protein
MTKSKYHRERLTSRDLLLRAVGKDGEKALTEYHRIRDATGQEPDIFYSRANGWHIEAAPKEK